MTPELEEKFDRAFPVLMENCQLCVGDGWAPLLWDLFIKISLNSPGVQLTQVKEKFGGLRVYVNWANDEVYGLINEAEQRSYSICEDCGTEENVKCEATGRLVVTLCGKCREEFSKKLASSSNGKDINLSS